MSRLFELKDISYGYIDGGKKRLILDNLSYTFEKGVFYTILGPSGSGKTTLLSLASALDEPETGAIYYNGTDIKKMGYRKFRRDHMSMIFQKYNLIDYLNGVENVQSNIIHTDKRQKIEKKEIAYKVLHQVGIVKTKADRRVNKLSGGEQQRIAIARALAKDVTLVLADEPTGALDTATAKEVIGIFKKLSHELGKTVIIVTHSDEIAHSSDVILGLKNGKLVQLNGGISHVR
jgi:ABC-type antimicrobial peptide transport system, ATPase component